MPRILVYGSVNIDHVYHLDRLVQPGQTFFVDKYRRQAGGKGSNQAIAAARAGASVAFAGLIGADGGFLRDLLRGEGVDVLNLVEIAEPTGHAIIQIDKSGENAIIVYGGANQCVTFDQINFVLSQFQAGDWLIAQNEISANVELLRWAKIRGLRLVVNPAPMDAIARTLPLELVDILIVNEHEGHDLTGQTEPSAILAALQVRCPQSRIVLTLGGDGVLALADGETIVIPAEKVKPVDTVGAGDTFVGYLTAMLVAGRPFADALKLANRAAGIAVTRPGAADSIPRLDEVLGGSR
ncbi:MAG: ribokinase [Verrucomicrobiota bacterium]|nr:ribokinase [Verrucomicrobiota bacterium]